MKIYFVSLGCDKNLVDSEVMLGILREGGHEITLAPEEADVCVVNTCGFIADAVNESIETVLKLGEYKKSGNCKKLIVTGCMAQRYRSELQKDMPEVDAILGVSEYSEIGRIIGDAALEGEAKRVTITPQHFAYLKIAEGCDNFCTYCTIPSIRGKYVSREMDGLLKEAAMLAENGVKELVLVAQDTSLHGTDLYGRSMLPGLLQKLAQIAGLCFIRIMYCYPEHITDELIAEMAANPKVCHYLDMPIQHADNAVLKRMGRRSTAEGLRGVIAKLRAAMPDIVLRTTLIAGFPGETEQEFTNLLKFVKEIRFDRLGVFAYSREDGTPAYKMKPQIAKPVKERRRDKLMSVQKDISAEKCKSFVGKTLTVLTDGFLAEDGVYCGRSYADAYDTDGYVFFESEEQLMTGAMVQVTITGSSDYDLYGKIAEAGDENELGE